jgi:hypothetical protein
MTKRSGTESQTVSFHMMALVVQVAQIAKEKLPVDCNDSQAMEKKGRSFK